MAPLPSKLVSMHHERYHVSRFFSFASRSYFSRVLLSTIPVKYMIWPPIVDFPASGKNKKVFSLKFRHSEKINDYILEVGNLDDTETVDYADFNALEVPPGGGAESWPSHPDSLVF